VQLVSTVPSPVTQGHVDSTKSFGESGRSNASAGFQKTLFSHNTKAHDDQKSSATSSSAKFDRFAEEKAQGSHRKWAHVSKVTVP